MVGKRRRGIRTSLGIANKKFSFRGSRLLFLLLFLSSILLRLYLIYLRKFPAGDEIWAYLLTKADFKNIWFATLADFHGPFYFLFLHAIKIIFPVELTIVHVRLVSLLFGIAGSLALWSLGSRALGKRGGLFLFYLSLFLPGYVWASIYARYYSFLILLTTISLIFFLDFLRKGEIKYLIYLTILSVLGAFTHYYFLLIDFSFFIFFVFERRYRYLLKKWIFALGAILIFCIPLFVAFLTLQKPEISGRIYNEILKIPSVLIANLTSWETFLYLYYWGNPIIYVPILLALFVSTGVLLCISLFNWKNKIKFLFAYIFFFPPAAGIAVSYTLEPLLAVGSLIIFLPALLLLILKAILTLFKFRGIIVSVFVLSIFLSLILFFQSSYTYSVPRRDFQFISDNIHDGDIIISSHFGSFLMSTYYLGSRITILGIRDKKTSTYLTQKALGYKVITVESLLNLKNRIWYLEPYYGVTDEARKIKQALDNNFKLVKKEIFNPEKKYKENFEFFNVYLYFPSNLSNF